MNRLLRTLAPAILTLGSCLHTFAQSEPAALPVRPVPATPQPEPPVEQPQPAAPPVTRMPAVDDPATRIAKLQSDISRLASDLANERVQSARLRDELAKARTDAGRARSEVKDSHDRLASERDALAEQVAILTAGKDRAEAQREQARVDLASARARLEVFEKSLREDAPPDAAALRDAVREAQNRVDMTVRAFAIVEQENNRIKAQLGSSNPQNFKADLAAAEQHLRQAQNDLAAERIRSANLARELTRARPGMPLVINEPVAPSAPTAPTLAPPEPVEHAPNAKIHTVAEGETLSGIAKTHYGSASRWTEIYNANRDIMRSENHLVPGMKLRIP